MPLWSVTTSRIARTPVAPWQPFAVITTTCLRLCTGAIAVKSTEGSHDMLLSMTSNLAWTTHVAFFATLCAMAPWIPFTPLTVLWAWCRKAFLSLEDRSIASLAAELFKVHFSCTRFKALSAADAAIRPTGPLKESTIFGAASVCANAFFSAFARTV